MSNRRAIVFAAVLSLLFVSASAQQTLTRGNQLLMNSGTFSIEAMVYPIVGGNTIGLDINQYKDANFTAACFQDAGDEYHTGPAPGEIRWSALARPSVGGRDELPLGSLPWLPNMVSYQYEDEQCYRNY